jgi:hypothetical protein
MKKLVIKNKVTQSISKITLILLIPVTVLYSCNFRNSQKLIPEKEFVKVLTELYIADGLLGFPSIRNHFSSKDSITNYIDIIERNGFTKERMDRTLKYYYDKKPKKLENIYDQVLSKLSEKQLLLDKSISVQKTNPSNYWTGAGFISVPEAGVQNQGLFNIAIKDTGNYILEFTAIVFPDDQSVNPNVTVYFYHADTSKSGYKDFWPVTKLVKDGQRHTFSLSSRNTNLAVTHISGSFFACDPREGRWEKHARIENIVLRKDIIK